MFICTPLTKFQQSPAILFIIPRCFELNCIAQMCVYSSELKIPGTLPPIGLAYDRMKPNFTSSRACSTSRHARFCCETFSRYLRETINLAWRAHINDFHVRANGSKIVVYFRVLSYIFVFKVYLKHVFNPTE